MTEVVLFPDATAVAIGILADAFTERAIATPVLPRTPDPRPATFVVVRRTGGVSRDIVIDDPLVTVESWADSDEDASDLAQLCRGILHASTGTSQGGVAIYRTDEASGPANLPDPVSEQPRYTQTFLVAMRGTAEVIGS